MLTRTIVFALVAILAFSSCGKKHTETTKVGVILPLTGDLAIYGEKMKTGIDLALDELNNSSPHEKREITLSYEDDGGDPKNSVAAFEKLVTIENVSLVIGGAISSCALATVPVAQKHNVVLFSPAATSPKLTGISPFFFRNWPSDYYEGRVMADFAAKQLHLKNIALLFVNNDWGLGITSVFKDAAIKDGCHISHEETFEPGAVSFRTQLVKLKNSHPDAIYVIGYVKELIPLLNQRFQLGMKAIVLSSYGMYDEQILRDAPNASEGAIFTAPKYDTTDTNPAIEKFIMEYQARYSRKPDIWSAQAFDAFNIVASVIEKGTATTFAIRDSLATVRDFEGASGLTTFDRKGDVQKPMRVMTVKGGQFVVYASSN